MKDEKLYKQPLTMYNIYLFYSVTVQLMVINHLK